MDKYLCLIIILLLSCKSQNKSNIVTNNISSCIIENIDSIIIDASPTSLFGNWIIKDSNLFFCDDNIVRINKYSHNGELLAQYLNKGRGPKEFISPPLSITDISFNKSIYIDKNSNFITIDNSFNKISEFNLIAKLSENCDINDLLKNPNFKNPAMYELDISAPKALNFGKYLVFPITTEHVKYNGYNKKDDAKEFYNESYTLMALDTATLSNVTLFGNFPDTYQNKIIPNFKDLYIACDSNLLFAQYEADSKIYTYNKNLELIDSFGEPINNINPDKPNTSNLEEAESNYKKHRVDFGYYGSLTYQNGLLFREGFHKNKYTIQIYRDKKYIGEINSDHKIKIIGYIAPHYYVYEGANLEDELFTIKRITINEKEVN